jgi:hypothetical protein
MLSGLVAVNNCTFKNSHGLHRFHGTVIYHSHSEWHEEAPSKGALGWLAPKGPEIVAPGKPCQQFKSPPKELEPIYWSKV